MAPIFRALPAVYPGGKMLMMVMAAVGPPAIKPPRKMKSGEMPEGGTRPIRGVGVLLSWAWTKKSTPALVVRVAGMTPQWLNVAPGGARTPLHGVSVVLMGVDA